MAASSKLKTSTTEEPVYTVNSPKRPLQPLFSGTPLYSLVARTTRSIVVSPTLPTAR